ncbi:hypothetical protein BDR07DRAFT_1420552, partial [Suillus spraguei]
DAHYSRDEVPGGRHFLRPDTTIFVKNIPYGTTVEQILEMFELHGELSRVIVSPAGTMVVPATQCTICLSEPCILDRISPP